MISWIFVWGLSGLIISDTMSIVDCRLTPVKENEILHKFRKFVEGFTTESFSDECLLRTLRAKNFDLRRAEKAFKFTYNTRQTYRFDTITKSYIKSELMKKCEFASFMGFDKDGSPIQYAHMGNADLDGFLRTNNIFHLCMYSGYSVESLLELQRENDKKTGRRGEPNFTAVFDFENFSLQNIAYRHVVEIGLDMLRMFQDFYPGILNHVMIINAPVYFSIAFNLIKPILRMDIMEKLVICSKESTPEEMLKIIDADVLPVFLGGKKVDENGDPKCSSFLKFGCKIPKSEYSKSKPWLRATDEGVSEMTIPPRSGHDMLFEVKEPGSQIQFEFWSDQPIGLFILYRKNDTVFPENMDCPSYHRCRYPYEEIISPYSKIQSHIVQVNNTIYCPRSGTYIFRFDNTFSWIASKYIVYRTQVYPPSSSIKLDNLNNNNYN